MPDSSLCMAQEAGEIRDDDRDLCRRLSRGEPAALDEVMALYGPFVSRLARRLLGWKHAEAEDVVQEVFVQVYLKAGAFRGDSLLKTWLTRVTINQCRSLQRRKWIRLDRLWRELWERKDVQDQAVVEDVAGSVRAAVQRLPAREREVIVMYYLEEMPVTEVAQVLGITHGAVNVRLHRARKHLEVWLGVEGGRSNE